MLTREENELITRVGPDAPMGKMLRRYWIPACLSQEIPEPDGTPLRVRLLGENLVAFRDTSGRIGLLAEHCPHRGASLVLGRNEESGIRCIYHGWKMDVEGNVVDTPCEPADSTFKERIKHLAYPTREMGDVVWAYMGPTDRMPVFPEFEWTAVPKTNRVVLKVREEANWLQAIEGAIDSAHSSLLHSSATNPRRPSRDTAPRIEVEETVYGLRYAAIRKPIQDPDRYKYVRVTLFVAPFHCLVPPKAYGSTHIFVPIDDEHTWFYGVNFSADQPIDENEVRTRRGLVMGLDLDLNFRKTRTLENNYLQNREAMKAGKSFTGIRGVPNQDMAVQESMGPISDRTKEHLGQSDAAIIRMRRRILGALSAFLAGEDPPGLDPSIAYRLLRSEEKVVPIDTPWQAVGTLGEGYIGLEVSHANRESGK
jgi:phthalate 4,5-dioxygenase oxygenase subunit